MKNSASISSSPAGGLSALPQVALSPQHSSMLEEAKSWTLGPPAWRARKVAEARDLLALCQIAPRLRVNFLELVGDLRAMVDLKVPVPCQPDKDGNLTIATHARLGITLPHQALADPLRGYSFVQILEPLGTWHANIAFGPVQSLCLGPDLPAGVPVRELVLLAYGALSMQSVQFDVLDPAGVLNPEAALWWQKHGHLIPLSKVPFLGTDDLQPRRPGGAG